MVCVVDADEPVNLQLPNQWLWDIIDEFIYQVWTGSYVGFTGIPVSTGR